MVVRWGETPDSLSRHNKHPSTHKRTPSPPARVTCYHGPHLLGRSRYSPSRDSLPRRSPSAVVIGQQLEIPIKMLGTAARTRSIPNSTPFSAEVINASRLEKVKMPTLELYDGTMGLKEHLVVYKTEMYIQDMDDAAYCRCFPATLKGLAQS